MVPTPQELCPRAQQVGAAENAGARVVISGMSGLYPNSYHVKDLADILYNKKNPVTSDDCRWKYDHPEVVKFGGKVPGLDLFDAQFFKVHYLLGNSMDAMARKVLEQSYQAIYDAGVSPEHLNGRKIGVYIGTCFSETEKTCFYAASTRTGFGIAGCNKSMFANRISYWLNAKGPSMSVDNACCSSAAAVELAHLAISRGDCEAAIVGGANLCLHPQSSIHYGRVMKLSTDGTTKSFDSNACGCVKSEAINVLFLQKANDARRVYAEIVHVKTEFNTLSQGETDFRYGFYRDPQQMTGFLNQFYKEAHISPQAIEYVEAFGAAVPDADKAELEAIENVFCKDRSDPLLVGSVTSNIGYVEAASGISAITKVLLGYHTGRLAANLHCDSPRRDIAALQDGRMQIVTDHQPFNRTYVAINGLSLTGGNSHVLLNGHYKPKDLERYKSNIPHLVTISGRQESSVRIILNDLKSRPIDPEELALLHNIHETTISGHLGRGYTILDTNVDNQTVSLSEKMEYFDYVKRPLWFVYSGMGSQWAGMGIHLMRIPIFAAAIERCRRVLEPKGVDIVHIITSEDKKIFDNILNSFVGIAAIQIGLTDILRELGLVPDKIIGHSVGELGCAYADGCFTAEEMILSAYSRGFVSIQTPFIKGSMAAVGIGFQQICNMCPPEIEVACHNGPESCTISGPADVMRDFVAQLTAKNIFAKEVPCSNIAYHSRYIAEAGPRLLTYLKEVIKSPKLRSERWMSTSVPMENWNKPSAMYSSAEYHTNNLLNPVLFEETSRLIPADAVLVEVAPHGLLQAILKRSLPVTCRNISLTRRGHPDNTRLVLEAVGQLYMEGFNPKVEALYPKIEFPVSTGTPMLSHLIEWAHHEKWTLPLYISANRKQTASTKFVISLHDLEHRYLQGNVIQDKILYPYSAALVAVWDTLAMVMDKEKKQISVMLRDVYLYNQPIMHDARQLRFSVALHRGTGRFEVMEEHSRVASGYATYYSEEGVEMSTKFESQDFLDTNSIYQNLFVRDYSYTGEFRSIHSADMSLTKARMVWRDNWVTFIDGLLQLNVLRQQHETVTHPDYIRKLVINVEDHMKDNSIHIDNETLKIADISKDVTRCGGITIENIQFYYLPTITNDKISIKTLKFIPHFSSEPMNPTTALQVYLQVVAENITKNYINILEITNDKHGIFKLCDIKKSAIPGIKCSYSCLEKIQVLEQPSNFMTDVDLVIVSNLSTDDLTCQMLYRVLPRETFLINYEDSSQSSTTIRPTGLYRVVSSHRIINSGILELARWRPINTASATSTLSVCTPSDLDLLSASQASLPSRQKLLVLTAYPPLPGLKDLIKTWRKESNRNIYLLMINQKFSEDQDLDQIPNLELAFNILNHGKCGGEYFTSLEEETECKGNMMLRSARVGDLNSLHWVQAPRSAATGIRVTVHYAGINDLDMNTATGMISSDYSKQAYDDGYGMDFSGVTDGGNRVMGLIQRGALRSSVSVHPDQLWPVPAHWSLEDAATVPLAYCLAYYCLDIKYTLRKGSSILIHGGAGALGQAAISVALSLNCEVFATVRDINKKKFLLKMFPNLKAENIGSSRDVTFADMVMNVTNGKGVNIVLCSVKGELKSLSLKICRLTSTLLDVHQIQTREKYSLGMSYLNREMSYNRVDLTSLFTQGNSSEIKLLHRIVSEGIARGSVLPLSRVTYAPHDAPRAFRLLASSNHRGRVLLNLQQADQLSIQPRLQCSADLYHCVFCDEDCLAQLLGDTLISRGVRKLQIHRLKPTFDFELKMRQWESTGAQVKLFGEGTAKNKSVFDMVDESSLAEAVEGVYVVLSEGQQSASDLASIVGNLDRVTKKSYPKLKYFGIVSTDSSIDVQTCVSRQTDNLPATVVKLPAIRKMNDASNFSRERISVRDAIGAVERALCSTEPMLMVHVNSASKLSVLRQLASVADITVPDNVDTNTTLSELSLNGSKMKTIHALLNKEYNIALTEEEIPQLTLKKLLDIEKSHTDLECVNQKGLKTFISHVVSDELLATTEMVFLPTLTSGTTRRSDEFDVNETHLCIVPGIEGHHARFEVLCERLKLAALVLQPGLDCPGDSVREMARKYAKILLEKTALKTNYYLLGYESGVMVALEIAAILEEHGLTGTIFCIGAPPGEFKGELKEQLSEFETEVSLQDAVLRHMFTLMSNTGIRELDDALNKCNTWGEKLKTTVGNLLGRVPHSAQYARQLIEGAYGRLSRLLEYEPDVKALGCKLVLLYPTPAAAGHSADSARRSLQQHSLQPVAVHELRAPMAHAAEDLRCAAFINNYLEKSILDAFEKKNLCETFLLNADSFMTI